MKEQLVDGTPVLAPETGQQLEEALASGRPFTAPAELAEQYGLPGTKRRWGCSMTPDAKTAGPGKHHPGRLTRISHTHTKHRSPGDVKFMYAINLTRFPTEDRCPHTVSPFPWHFKGARGAG